MSAENISDAVVLRGASVLAFWLGRQRDDVDVLWY